MRDIIGKNHNSTEISGIMLNILGGLIVSVICLLGAYVQIKILRSYAEAGMRELISPLSFLWALSLILLGLVFTVFVMLNLKKKIEIEKKAE